MKIGKKKFKFIKKYFLKRNLKDKRFYHVDTLPPKVSFNS